MKFYKLIIISMLACLPLQARKTMLQGIPDKDIHPEGWVRTMLENQRDHFTGVLAAEDNY